MFAIAVLIMGILFGTGPTNECAAVDSLRQTAKHLQRPIQKTVELQYLLYLPNGYGLDNRQWPILLFLHGSGSRGTELDSVKIDGPPRMIDEGREFPFIVVSPQCPAGESWSVDALEALLDEIIKTYRVDEDRIYVTGLSMGGFGTWRLAKAIPNRLAAIVPICGGGDPKTAEVIKHIPTWVFHGAKDEVVGIANSTDMVNALYAVGSDVRFTVYPEAGHVEAWRQAYADETLWSWLAAQRRQKRP